MDELEILFDGNLEIIKTKCFARIGNKNSTRIHNPNLIMKERSGCKQPMSGEADA